ncbi:hypothetical protein SRB17_55380 [Streptomyces sp. RB17]|uniref:carbamoyltransferase C-terminal domain-containing protein n=1 Tax=Streptomyces sp. RB17 TaxID=2585197 RepID=UPI00130B6C20|nr:carbamoyltransferase C-terminal domain-containing protein [Streptomyces sp. RB17]MQY37534.1 hypothetical protein [Streptomyces sp. RB17]
MTGGTPLSRRRSLVTGGAGFLGSHRLDISPPDGAQLLPAPYDPVLHFVGPASPADHLRLPPETLDVGRLGTRNALTIAARDGARLVLASTSELAPYGTPRVAERLREYVQADAQGGFGARPVPWADLVRARPVGGAWSGDQADRAAGARLCLAEAVLAPARWLRGRTGEDALTMAGGVTLNCVANTRLWRESGFRHVRVQPAAGDAGTALGAAAHVAGQEDTLEPMPTAALGRCWSHAELRQWLERAAVPYDCEEPADIAETAADGIVAWFQGRGEYGPCALGHRSPLARPGKSAGLEQRNAVKSREELRPVAPMVLAERAAGIFDGPLPSPHMPFVHDVAAAWKARIPAVVHVDGTARMRTVDRGQEPLVAWMTDGFERRTGLPVAVNASLDAAGRPMVDDPRDALECFGSAPVELLVLGPFAIRRGKAFA